MAEEISGDKQQEPENLDPQCVADVFVKKYFAILEKSPEIVHKFYKDHSVIKRLGPDGAMLSVTTMQNISDTILSSDYKGCLAEILNADFQESLMGGIIVAVNGYLIMNDNMRKSFYQTFFLARQEKGFYVLNDILRFTDAHQELTLSTFNETNTSSLIVHLTHALETASLPSQPEPTDASVVEDDNKKVSNANESSSPTPVPQILKEPSTAPQIPKEPSTVPQILKEPSTVPQIPKEPSTAPQILKESSTVPQIPKKPSTVPQIPKEPSTVPQIPKEPSAPKTSYASMVAKPSKVTTLYMNTSVPVVVTIAPTTEQPSKTSSILKNPSNNAAKGLNSSNNAAEHFSSNGDVVTAKTVYIGNLPSNITKNGLIDELNEFGRVKQDGIQLRTFEDGFCFGFVEFESASSARKAVEVHNVTIGGKDAYILYKKSSVRSGEFHGNGFRQDSRQNGESNFKNRNQIKDTRGGSHGRETYRTNEKRSNGEVYPRHFHHKDDPLINGGDGFQGNNQGRFSNPIRGG